MISTTDINPMAICPNCGHHKFECICDTTFPSLWGG